MRVRVSYVLLRYLPLVLLLAKIPKMSLLNKHTYLNIWIGRELLQLYTVSFIYQRLVLKACRICPLEG